MASSWPSFEKIPPSAPLRWTKALLPEENSEADAESAPVARGLVELVERFVRTADMREFVEPKGELVPAPRRALQSSIVNMGVTISLIESGALEEALASSPDYLSRLRVIRTAALQKFKATRSILVASIENEDGAARGETPEQRLRRSIETAKTEEPIDVGSFAGYVDDE